MSRYATIIGTGRYLPEIEVSNAALKERVGAVDPELANVVDSFEESSGIRSRWYTPRDWAASDIAVRAAQEALKAAEIQPEPEIRDVVTVHDIDMQVVDLLLRKEVQHRFQLEEIGTHQRW